MQFINLHTHSASGEGIEIVNMYPRTFIDASHFSIGIHPWHIEVENIDSDLAIIEQKIQLKSCSAIGECGLDKKVGLPIDQQIPVFESHLKLAEKYRKPVVIHCVAAFQELIEIKQRLKISVPMIIHGYSKNGQLAKQLLANGFYLSFGEQLLRNQSFGDVFKQVPDDRYFLETDSADYSIAEIYAEAASIKGAGVDKIIATVRANYDRIFNQNN